MGNARCCAGSTLQRACKRHRCPEEAPRLACPAGKPLREVLGAGEARKFKTPDARTGRLPERREDPRTSGNLANFGHCLKRKRFNRGHREGSPLFGAREGAWAPAGTGRALLPAGPSAPGAGAVGGPGQEGGARAETEGRRGRDGGAPGPRPSRSPPGRPAATHPQQTHFELPQRHGPGAWARARRRPKLRRDRPGPARAFPGAAAARPSPGHGAC